MDQSQWSKSKSLLAISEFATFCQIKAMFLQLLLEYLKKGSKAKKNLGIVKVRLFCFFFGSSKQEVSFPYPKKDKHTIFWEDVHFF